MATNFPTSLDALSNPTSSNKLNDAGVVHADQHANANDAIEALQAKVGINGSAVTTSLDYKVSTLLAPKASPTFTGTVTFPLTTAGYVTTTSGGVIGSVATIPNAGLTNSTITIGTTAVSLGGSITTLPGVTSVNGTTIPLNGGTLLTSTSTTSALTSFGNSPALAGTPTAPTAAVDTNTTQIATTAYVIAQSYLKTATASSTYAPIASPTFTGQVTVPAGTTSASPIIFQSGSLLTNAAGGRMEYDGRLHYLTPSSTAVGGRAIAGAAHYFALAADRNLTNVNTAQSIFGVGLTVQATTTYEIEMLVAVSTTGTTSNSLGISFGGTATLTSIGCQVEASQNATSFATLTSGSQAFINTAANTAVTAAVATATYRNVWIKGIVRVNASGTFIPQLTYSAAPGVAPVVASNSYIKMTPIGVNTVTTVGAWA